MLFAALLHELRVYRQLRHPATIPGGTVLSPGGSITRETSHSFFLKLRHPFLACGDASLPSGADDEPDMPSLKPSPLWDAQTSCRY
jgi:hypothetical protein